MGWLSAGGPLGDSDWLACHVLAIPKATMVAVGHKLKNSESGKVRQVEDWLQTFVKENTERVLDKEDDDALK